MLNLIGKSVIIYPSDSKKKQGIIRETHAQGIMFEITKSEDINYKAGKLHFISYSANLSFEIM
jgi:hypothetical protein